MLDISKLGTVSASDNGADMDLLNPFNLEKTGAMFHLLGFDSPSVVQAGREYNRGLMRSPLRKEAEEADHNRKIVLALASLRGWSNFCFGSEKPIEYSPQKAKEILENPDFFWISEQIYYFASTRANFTPATLES
jgi:hypothetical protein